jgi:hypothetical protein
MSPTPQQLTPSELATINWRISSHTGSGDGGTCVEVGTLSDGSGRVAVRHSQWPNGAILVYSAAEWTAFEAGMQAGEFHFES